MNAQRTFAAARRVAFSSCLVGLAAASYAVPAPTVINGIPFESELMARGTQLQLKGAGLRTAVVFKIYAGGLYLPKKASTLNDVTSQLGIKRWHVVFLREFEGNDLGEQFIKAMEKGPLRRMALTLAPSRDHAS